MTPLAGPLMRLISRSPGLRRSAVICVVLALITAATEIAVALTLLPVLASLGVTAGSELSGLVDRVPNWAWLVLFGIAAALRSLANWQFAVREQQGAQQLVVTLQSRLYRALASAHWDAVRRLAPPTITSALQTQTYDAGYGFSSMVQTIAAILLVAGYLVASIAVFPLMLPVVLLLLGFMWWLNVRRNAHVLTVSEDYHGAQTELHERYEDWVAISRISSLGVDPDVLADRFERSAQDAASHSVGYTRASAATRISYEVAVVLAILVGVPTAWWLDTPPALLAFGLVLIVRVLPRAGSIQVGYQGVIGAVAPIQSIDRLAQRLEADAVALPQDRSRLDWKSLKLHDLGVEDTQREHGRRWLLRDVSLGLKHGEWLALSGETGSGKTTLAEVMLMLVRPDAGDISIDGEIVTDELAGRWRDQAAYVPQDVVLFDASIRANLCLYVPDATDAELEAALQQAAADFVMTRLPEGLDTRAGPGGRWLSGGERQRIGIARALLRKPGFLVLDEPTAALDEDTQAKLMAALAKLEHTMSVVLITHRPELLQLADRIVEIKDGELRYSGPDRRHR